MNECEEKAKASYNLEETVKNLLEKLENTEKKNLRADELSALKDDEIDSLKIRNEKLVSGNKALRNESKELVKEFDLFKRESMQSKKKLDSSIELLESLEKGLVNQRSEAKVDLMKVENERAELKLLREKSLIEKNEVSSQSAGKCRVVTMDIQAVDKGQHMERLEFKPLVDSGVHKTLISEADWKVMKKKNKSLRIKKCRVKFTPYQTKEGLQMLGRTKAILRAAGGATVNTIVYVVRGSGQSLLGLKDGENLGIIEINPEGKTDQVVVRQLATFKKEQVPRTGVVSGGETQDEITNNMERLVGQFPELFRGVGTGQSQG